MMFNFKKTLLGLGLASLGSLGFSAISQAQPPVPKVYQVKNLQIGALPVKTIVPITGPSQAQALAQAQSFAQNPAIDVVELRIDLLDFYQDAPRLADYLQHINQILAQKPLIATIRTAYEGGKFQGSSQDYAAIYQQIIQQHWAQLIDLEMFREPALIKALIAQAHQAGILVLMSNHDFQKTPSQEEIVKRLMQQDAWGADILKIALMPQSKADVLRLMQATFEVSQKSNKPLLTMSMGQLGSISRVASASIGNSLSFAMSGQASAPGQIEVTQLKQLLKAVQPSP
jgi:3-dehydroquinate dehydratase-1